MKINSFLKNSIFRTGLEEKSSLKPLLYSLIISFIYIILVSIYIWLSGKYAFKAASSEINLRNIELIKGLIFSLVTGAGLFVFLFLNFRKIKLKDEIIITQNKSIIVSERLVMAALFSSSITHDMNNILSIITGNSQLLRLSDNILNEEDKKHIEIISEATNTITILMSRMRNACNGHIPDNKEFIDINSVIKETVDFAKTHNKIKNCELNCEMPEKRMVNLNTTLFSRTLMNLILNAAEANNQTGKIFIKLKQNDETIIIEVHDNGPGIPDKIKKKIMEPFFTTKEYGNGLGLLSLKIFIKQHNGTVEIKKSELGGACFILTIPKI